MEGLSVQWNRPKKRKYLKGSYREKRSNDLPSADSLSKWLRLSQTEATSPEFHPNRCFVGVAVAQVHDGLLLLYKVYYQGAG